MAGKEAAILKGVLAFQSAGIVTPQPQVLASGSN
jgi:hypothetical protein